VDAGAHVRVVGTHGQQVVDTWAFNRAEMSEFMSMEHCRAKLGRTVPCVGDAMCTDRRRPILTIVGDDSGGVHDTLIAACDTCRAAPGTTATAPRTSRRAWRRRA
jgi:uncharacterized protein YcgI (DUF1989 family)